MAERQSFAELLAASGQNGYHTFGDIREDIGELRGEVKSISASVNRIEGRIDSLSTTIAAGQSAQDTRLVEVATAQAEARGSTTARSGIGMTIAMLFSGIIGAAATIAYQILHVLPPHVLH